MVEGSWVGLDVHARSVVAGVLDAGTGELRTLGVPRESELTVAWLQTLPQPTPVAYEAGPTGYGLARGCAQAGIACTVAAPRRSHELRATGSSLTAATPSASHGCCVWVNWAAPARRARRAID